MAEPTSALASAEQLLRANNPADAWPIIAAVLAQRPRDPRALHLGAIAKVGLGDADTAATMMCSAADYNIPTDFRLHVAAGRALLTANRGPEAIARLTRVTAARADIEPLQLLGHAHRISGDLNTAIDIWKRCLRLTNDPGHVYQDLTTALTEVGRPNEAVDLLTAYLAIPRASPAAHSLLGMALSNAGRPAEAIAHYDAALAHTPGNADLQFNRAAAKLATGDYSAAAWADHETRFARPGGQHRKAPYPGDAFNPAVHQPPTRVLVCQEQGFGDNLFAARFAPVLAAKGYAVTLQVPDAAKSLIARSLPGLTVIGPLEPAPAYDAVLPCMSLMAALDATPTAPPITFPYLRANRTPHDGFRVGLCWSGQLGNDDRRPIPFSQLWSAVGGLAGVTYHSLQLGDPARDIAGTPVIDHSTDLPDLAATADLAATLDLVITIDTSVAHLCGAIAAQTAVLLHAAPDWRWGATGDTTPWYPALTLFRQPAPRDWATPLARLAEHVRTAVAAR